MVYIPNKLRLLRFDAYCIFSEELLPFTIPGPLRAFAVFPHLTVSCVRQVVVDNRKLRSASLRWPDMAWCPYSVCEDRSYCSEIWKMGFWRTLTTWLVQFVVLDEESKFEMFFPNGSVMQLVCTAFRIMISCLPPALYAELAHFLVRPCRTEFASCIDFNVRAGKGMPASQDG